MRTVRPGNIGPALIDISASKAPGIYRGLNLNTHPEWVFRSPMSWHPDGTRALWPEGLDLWLAYAVAGVVSMFVLNLGVTEGTVKAYLHALYAKADVRNRTELALRADALLAGSLGD